MWSSSLRVFGSGPAWLWLTLVVLLSSCGFRLQGAASYPEAMEVTFIDTEDRYTPFYRKLRISLEQGGVTVSESPVDATAVVRIESDDTGQRVLTVSARNVPTEYDVYYKIRYSVWIDGEEVVSSRSLSRRQDYTYDPTEVLGKNREEEFIREALADNLVAQVGRELSKVE